MVAATIEPMSASHGRSRSRSPDRTTSTKGPGDLTARGCSRPVLRLGLAPFGRLAVGERRGQGPLYAYLGGPPANLELSNFGGAVPVRIFLLDDHEIVRRGLRELFEAQEDFQVVGEASDAEEAMTRVPPTRPDVAVLDVRLPGASGIEVCRDLRAAMPELRCLMLTSFADDDALFSAVLAGASGYLLKQIRGPELVTAVPTRRGRPITHRPRAHGGRHGALRGKQEDVRIAKLSPQERRILDLIAEGKTNRQIGDEMFLAEKTVKNYVSNLLQKMGFSRRTEAAVYAARSKKRAEARELITRRAKDWAR